MGDCSKIYSESVFFLLLVFEICVVYLKTVLLDWFGTPGVDQTGQTQVEFIAVLPFSLLNVEATGFHYYTWLFQRVCVHKKK